MDKLPEVCKDCAEYGSHFCEECLHELSENLNENEKVVLSKAIRNIENASETLGSTNAKDSEK